MQAGGHEPGGCALDIFDGAFEFDLDPAEVHIHIRLLDIHLYIELSAKPPENRFLYVFPSAG